MLKIVPTQTVDAVTTLKIEGQIVGPWVNELKRSCEQILGTGTVLTLDVADVSFVARDGAQLLASLVARGVAVVNSSPFVAEQLRAGSPC